MLWNFLNDRNGIIFLQQVLVVFEIVLFAGNVVVSFWHFVWHLLSWRNDKDTHWYTFTSIIYMWYCIFKTCIFHLKESLILERNDLSFKEYEDCKWQSYLFSFPPFFGQDDDDNITRFLILAREPIIAGIDRPYKVFHSLAYLMQFLITCELHSKDLLMNF